MKILDDQALIYHFLKSCAPKKKFLLEEADRAIDELASTGDLFYYYKCPFCKKYHLTSKLPTHDIQRDIQITLEKRYSHLL